MNKPNLGGAAREEIGNTLEQQMDIARKSLNYPGRIAPPQPGVGSTFQDFERWAEIDRANGERLGQQLDRAMNRGKVAP